ncbi:lantibiotic immunity ABC transporter MutG family permease subunit [Clostridium niameyense]|uniref:Lantibiotic immunity ABC transporter MutG family permease subunit n=1 Tax=Clostridium niameyense TaxID=1622073 RepID=A0A6M0RCB0_9CLOT|nr:lantibiotic immunity ABC transporter MutG family permease subunit [Clostridium niameyense]NEZ47249.1 lantibiotic immunity ABC transporter MutG family permease subunit [Clostridium niameyense]
MDTFINGFKANFIKQKHSKISLIHIILPLIGALIFSLFFYNYPQFSNEKKLQVIIEIATSIFPLLIGIVTTIFLNIEEKNGRYRWFLAVGTSRTVNFCSFILYILFWGSISSFILWSFTLIGLVWQGVFIEEAVRLFFKLMVFFMIGNIFTYIFHVIISMRFGMGISLILSIFESVFVVFIGNMNNLDKWEAWKFLPHAFSVKISQITLWKNFGQSINVSCVTSWIMILAYTIILLIFSILWINRWEGKRSE